MKLHAASISLEVPAIFFAREAPPTARIAAATAIACAAAMPLMRILLKHVIAPQSYKAVAANKPELLWPISKIAVEWIPSLLVPLLAYPDTLAMTRAALADPARGMDVRAGWGSFAAAAAIFGYMAFDCAVMLIWRRESLKSMGTEMYVVVWLHHLISMCLWPLALVCDTGSALIGWFLLSESSNLTLLARALMAKLDLASHPAFVPVSLVWIAHFTLTRIVPLPLLVLILIKAEIAHKSPALWFFSYFAGPLPLLLNTYWFSLIVAGLIKRARGGKRRSSKKSE